MKWIAMLWLAAGSMALAQDRRSPLEEYQAHTGFSVMMCSLQFKTAQAQARLVQAGGAPPGKPADYAACVNEQRTEGKVKFDAAMKGVRKAGAREALKSVHVAYLTAIEGIRPGVDERVITYEQRQQALSDKLNEAWARFEVEK